MTTVAVLGIGTIGEPIARNLARAGFDVRAWNRTREKAEPLLREGATVCDSAAEAAEGAEIVLTVLVDADSTAATVAEVEFAADAVWVQTATVGFDGAERLAELAQEKGVVFVDAPVLGTRQPAEQGKLVVLASGPDAALDRCGPLFDAIGHSTRRLGPVPNGSKLKLVTNLWLLAVTEAAAEAIALAEGLGLDPREFLATMEGSQIDTPYLHLKGEARRSRAASSSATATRTWPPSTSPRSRASGWAAWARRTPTTAPEDRRSCNGGARTACRTAPRRSRRLPPSPGRGGRRRRAP